MAKDVDDCYERLDLIGEGTYGLVYKARDRKTNALVALKRIPLDSSRDGFPVTAMREIKLLAGICSPHVVALLDVCISRRELNAVYMVLEYVEFDLVGLMSYLKSNASGNGSVATPESDQANADDVCSSPLTDQPGVSHSNPLAFNIANVKCIMKQILQAVDHLHRECQIVHRDIKGSNILVGRSGLVKLVDFGLAKRSVHLCFQEEAAGGSGDFVASKDQSFEQCMTNRVITLWFRPPEILLGSNDYGFAVDIWGVGCILIEMLLGRPAFAGMDELSQLEAICRKLGPLPPVDRLSESDFPWKNMAMEALSDASVVFSDSNQCGGGSVDWLENVLGPLLGSVGLDLIRKMLALVPKDRISASDALRHRWFDDDEKSVRPENLINSILTSCDLDSSRFSMDWHELDHRKSFK